MNIKKGFLLIMLLAFLIPLNVSASQQSGQYYAPSGSDYHQKKFSWQLYSDFGIDQIRFTQFDIDGNEKGKINIKAKENDFAWVDFYCSGNVHIEFLDASGKVQNSLTRGQATSYLDDSSCNYKSFVKASNYDEKANKYKDDTFGKKKK